MTIFKVLGLGLVVLLCASLAQGTPRHREWRNKFATMQYQNDFDQPLSVSCSGIQGMYKVSSVHSNNAEDRAWLWECRNVVGSGSVSGCSETGYVNEFDLPMNYMCPANQYIAGVYSYHDNGAEDRRWKFTCCAIPNRITVSCRQTGYVNDWDSPMNFVAGQGEVITGVYSYHDNGKEDRRYGFILCKMQ